MEPVFDWRVEEQEQLGAEPHWVGEEEAKEGLYKATREVKCRRCGHTDHTAPTCVSRYHVSIDEPSCFTWYVEQDCGQGEG